MNRTFDRFTAKVNAWLAKPAAFLLALALVLAWAALGPHFGWSEQHSLWINTTTTIVTFLMAFVILSSSARDTAALHLKIDELIRVNTDARNELIAAEAQPVDEIERLRGAVPINETPNP